MKKILLFLALFLIPFSVKANSEIYADVTVQKNGDLIVKEAIILDGNYNGFEIRLLNRYYGEYELYSAEDTEIIRVCEATISGLATINNVGTCFERVSDANPGDRLVYTLNLNHDTLHVKMFNPSVRGRKAFFIEYRLKNVVVRHDDIAELRLNIVSDDFEEYISNLEYRFKFIEEVSDLRIWGHGPYYGETKIIGNSEASFKISDFSPEDLDARLIFDLDIVSASEKNSNRVMMDKIIGEETELAEKANYCRDLARNDYDAYIAECTNEVIYKPDPNILKESIIIGITWTIGLVFIILWLYFGHDSEHRKINRLIYVREFPNDYSPEMVQYIVSKKIDGTGLSASLLNIIRKKGFTVKKITTEKGLIFKKDVDDYILTLNADANLTEPLTESEKMVQKLLVDNFSYAGGTFTTSSINERLSKESNARKFLDGYQMWVNDSTNLAKAENIFENKPTGIIGLAVVYALLPLIFTLAGGYHHLFILIPFSIGLIIYALSITRYTHYGLEQYEKWIGMKRFLNEFGSFKEKELLEVNLWEKYLVFATLFGCAEKLQKTLKVNMAELNIDDGINDFNNLMFYSYLNNVISSSIISSIATAQATIYKAEAARAANSSSSSGGGFGGGFSGGGGFGGGGGTGGGRF